VNPRAASGVARGEDAPPLFSDPKASQLCSCDLELPALFRILVQDFSFVKFKLFDVLFGLF